MTTSTIFSTAHATAKTGDFSISYRVRFAQALKAAWAAVKAPAPVVVDINTKMNIVLEKYERTLKGTFLSKSAIKELKSLILEDDFGFHTEDFIQEQKQRAKTIRATAVTLDEAYSLLTK
jgi:precorrin isomerase